LGLADVHVFMGAKIALVLLAVSPDSTQE